MATFPNIGKPFDWKRTTVKKSYRGTSSAGYTITHPKSTVAKKVFNITYDRLSKTERDDLDSFFDTNAGLSFTWTDPEDEVTTYEVVFEEDELEFEFSPPYYWTTTFTIREV